MNETQTPKTDRRPQMKSAGDGQEMKVPSHEEIARRAYERFLARGGEHGRHEEDWREAEQELANPR